MTDHRETLNENEMIRKETTAAHGKQQVSSKKINEYFQYISTCEGSREVYGLANKIAYSLED